MDHVANDAMTNVIILSLGMSLLVGITKQYYSHCNLCVTCHFLITF